MMPSFRAMNSVARSTGRPSSSRNTVDGRGSAMVEWKLQLPSSTTASMRSATRARIRSSNGAIRRGAKRGSRSLRNLAWSGGSIWSGISGRTWPMATASTPDEKTSGVRSTVSTSSCRLTRVADIGPMSTAMTGALSRSIRYMPWGARSISGSANPSGLPSEPAASIGSSGSRIAVRPVVDRDRLLRAVGGPSLRLLQEVGGHFGQFGGAVAVVVRLEHLRRQHVTTAVAGAAGTIHDHLHDGRPIRRSRRGGVAGCRP